MGSKRGAVTAPGGFLPGLTVDSASDEELQRELQRRALIRAKERWLERRMQADLVETHVSLLLDMVRHEGIECHDDYVVNEDKGCARCRLLSIKHSDGGISSYFVRNIEFEEVGEEP